MKLMVQFSSLRPIILVAIVAIVSHLSQGSMQHSQNSQNEARQLSYLETFLNRAGSTSTSEQADVKTSVKQNSGRQFSSLPAANYHHQPTHPQNSYEARVRFNTVAQSVPIPYQPSMSIGVMIPPGQKAYSYYQNNNIQRQPQAINSYRQQQYNGYTGQGNEQHTHVFNNNIQANYRVQSAPISDPSYGGKIVFKGQAMPALMRKRLGKAHDSWNGAKVTVESHGLDEPKNEGIKTTDISNSDIDDVLSILEEYEPEQVAEDHEDDQIEGQLNVAVSDLPTDSSVRDASIEDTGDNMELGHTQVNNSKPEDPDRFAVLSAGRERPSNQSPSIEQSGNDDNTMNDNSDDNVDIESELESEANLSNSRVVHEEIPEDSFRHGSENVELDPPNTRVVHLEQPESSFRQGNVSAELDPPNTRVVHLEQPESSFRQGNLSAELDPSANSPKIPVIHEEIPKDSLERRSENIELDPVKLNKPTVEMQKLKHETTKPVNLVQRLDDNDVQKLLKAIKQAILDPKKAQKELEPNLKPDPSADPTKIDNETHVKGDTRDSQVKSRVNSEDDGGKLEEGVKKATKPLMEIIHKIAPDIEPESGVPGLTTVIKPRHDSSPDEVLKEKQAFGLGADLLDSSSRSQGIPEKGDDVNVKPKVAIQPVMEHILNGKSAKHEQPIETSKNKLHNTENVAEESPVVTTVPQGGKLSTISGSLPFEQNLNIPSTKVEGSPKSQPESTSKDPVKSSELKISKHEPVNHDSQALRSSVIVEPSLNEGQSNQADTQVTESYSSPNDSNKPKPVSISGSIVQPSVEIAASKANKPIETSPQVGSLKPASSTEQSKPKDPSLGVNKIITITSPQSISSSSSPSIGISARDSNPDESSRDKSQDPKIATEVRPGVSSQLEIGTDARNAEPSSKPSKLSINLEPSESSIKLPFVDTPNDPIINRFSSQHDPSILVKEETKKPEIKLPDFGGIMKAVGARVKQRIDARLADVGSKAAGAVDFVADLKKGGRKQMIERPDMKKFAENLLASIKVKGPHKLLENRLEVSPEVSTGGLLSSRSSPISANVEINSHSPIEPSQSSGKLVLAQPDHHHQEEADANKELEEDLAGTSSKFIEEPATTVSMKSDQTPPIDPDLPGLLDSKQAIEQDSDSGSLSSRSSSPSSIEMANSTGIDSYTNQTNSGYKVADQKMVPIESKENYSASSSNSGSYSGASLDSFIAAEEAKQSSTKGTQY